MKIKFHYTFLSSITFVKSLSINVDRSGISPPTGMSNFKALVSTSPISIPP